MIKAILFDLDGVLVDAVDWHYEALNRALTLFGYPLNQREHESAFNGLPTYVKLRKLSRNSSLPVSLHPFLNEMKQKFTIETIKLKCQPSPALSQLLSDLSQQGYLLGLCSNSNRATVDCILDLMGIREWFDIVLSADDIKLPKPNPEIYENTFKMLGIEPEDCLIIEDSKPGIESATASSAHVLEVRSPSDLSLQLIQKKIKNIDGQIRTVRKISKASQTIEIVIPMAGLGTRFAEAGYHHPKPLIPVIDKPMIQWVVENVRPKDYPCHFTFICNEGHLKTLDVEKLLRSLEPTCTVVSAKEVTAGAACTVLLANNRLLSSRPVLIANSDQWVNFNIDHFIQDALERDSDGSILTFQATDRKWSYAKLDVNNARVIEVAEKQPISNHATVGIYFFKRASDLASGIRSMIRKDIRTNGEYYLCPVYNELIQSGKTVRIYEIPPYSMHGLGTPEDLRVFLEKSS